MSSAAERRLKELCAGILQNRSSPKTLAYFRLSNAAIVQDLEEFAASPKENEGGQKTLTKPLLDLVLDLFQNLNRHMAEQEQSCSTWGDFFVASKRGNCKIPVASPIEISVVLGGKYSKHPASISEQLVSKLVRRSQTVYTVSRSICKEDELPKNVTHIPKQNLDVGESISNGIANTLGADEFYDVMATAKEEWLKTSSSSPAATNATLVFYFTLGQHKGVNPFVRNLNAAQNFHRALRKLFLTSPDDDSSLALAAQWGGRNWRVVLTGTDATLPSTHPPSEMILPTTVNGNSEPSLATALTVPTYKIGTNNFVYAMSKLGQYYWIMNAVVGLLVEEEDKRYKDVANETKEIFQKIKNHIYDAGEDGAYHGENCSSMSMKELDEISAKMSSLIEEGFLRDHFRIAEHISICYTPLHANPWTADAIQSANDDVSAQRAYILDQIVKRFKNAISIESAASSHFL